MPYNLHKPTPANVTSGPKYPIKFRGYGQIPRIGQMAPTKVDLTMEQIEVILESLWNRPMRIQVGYVDPAGKEWEINYSTYKKVLGAVKTKVGNSALTDEQKAEVKEVAKETVKQELSDATKNMIDKVLNKTITPADIFPKDQPPVTPAAPAMEETVIPGPLSDDDLDQENSEEDSGEDDTTDDEPTNDPVTPPQNRPQNIHHGKHRRR